MRTQDGLLPGTAPAGRRPRSTPAHGDDGATAPLRTGVERGLVTVLATAGPLLVLLSLPAFAAERDLSGPLVVVSAAVAVLQCLLVPLALVRRGTPDHRWVLGAGAAYLVLVLLERFELRGALPSTYVPWLVSIACVGFSCVAVGLRRPIRSVVVVIVAIGGIASAYEGRVPTVSLLIDVLALTALAAGLIVGVRALRQRADRADEAQRAAQRLLDDSRRRTALEAERSRTDALLHDSVLSALLAAGSTQADPASLVLSARNALDIVSDSRDRPDPGSRVVTFTRVVQAMEREFAPMRDQVQLDLAAARDVELPIVVAETLVSATLQALANSIAHAGASTCRMVVASRTADGGIRISIEDDGRGFDPARIAPERLGVRISIIERMRQIGGEAEIRSAPGEGTVVVLRWSRRRSDAPADALTAGVRA